MAGKLDRLPRELRDETLNYLAGDKLSVAACSLISRTWLEAGQSHLFSDLEISARTGVQRFRQFHEFIYSSWLNQPKMVSYIRKLYLGDRDGKVKGKYKKVHSNLLGGILMELSKLRCLVLHRVDMGVPPPNIMDSNSRSF